MADVERNIRNNHTLLVRAEESGLYRVPDAAGMMNRRNVGHTGSVESSMYSRTA